MERVQRYSEKKLIAEMCQANEQRVAAEKQKEHKTWLRNRERGLKETKKMVSGKKQK